jgi:hypothetical protein
MFGNDYCIALKEKSCNVAEALPRPLACKFSWLIYCFKDYLFTSDLLLLRDCF